MQIIGGGDVGGAAQGKAHWSHGCRLAPYSPAPLRRGIPNTLSQVQMRDSRAN